MIEKFKWSIIQFSLDFFSHTHLEAMQYEALSAL